MSTTRGSTLEWIESEYTLVLRHVDDWKSRFWSYVDIKDEKQCWEWKGACNPYPQFNVRDTLVQGTRVSYELFNGPTSSPLSICHTCDNPKCVNPKHLFLGSTSDNALDSSRKGRWAPQGGIHNGQAKFTEDQIREMRKCYPLMTYQQIADTYGCSLSVAWHIVKGLTYKEVMP